MSMQKAQPLICDARVLTSSSNDFSSPHSSTYFCNEYMARKAPGAAFSYFRCSPIFFSFMFISRKFVSYRIHVHVGRKVTKRPKKALRFQLGDEFGAGAKQRVAPLTLRQLDNRIPGPRLNM